MVKIEQERFAHCYMVKNINFGGGLIMYFADKKTEGWIGLVESSQRITAERYFRSSLQIALSLRPLMTGKMPLIPDL